MLTRALATLSGLILLLGGSAVKADFKDILAERLGTSSEFLVLNIPPRPGAWPGAIFTEDMRFPLVRGRADDPALMRGSRTSLDSINFVDVSAGTKLGWTGWFSFAAKAGDVAHVTMSFPDVSIIDIDYGEILKRIKETAAVTAAARRDRLPLIVTRSYEATPTLVLIKKANISAEAWAKIQKTAVEAKLEAGALSEDRVVYKAVDRIVFAFEIMQATFDRAQAAQGKEIAFNLVKAPSRVFAAYEMAQDKEFLDAIVKTGEVIQTQASKKNAGWTIEKDTMGVGKAVCQMFGVAC